MSILWRYKFDPHPEVVATTRPKDKPEIEKATPSKAAPSPEALVGAAGTTVLGRPKDLALDPKRCPVTAPGKKLPDGLTWPRGANSEGHQPLFGDAAMIYSRMSPFLGDTEKKLSVDIL